jgi:hypothetical protein
MGREIECYNIVLLTIVLEFGVDVTLMAVKYQHPIYTSPAVFGILIKML